MARPSSKANRAYSPPPKLSYPHHLASKYPGAWKHGRTRCRVSGESYKPLDYFNKYSIMCSWSCFMLMTGNYRMVAPQLHFPHIGFRQHYLHRQERDNQCIWFTLPTRYRSSKMATPAASYMQGAYQAFHPSEVNRLVATVSEKSCVRTFFIHQSGICLWWSVSCKSGSGNPRRSSRCKIPGTRLRFELSSHK